MESTKGVPYHTVRGILKEHISNEVSKEYVNNVKCILDELIEVIAIASLEELDKSNSLRSLHNQRLIKRVDDTHQNIANYIKLYNNAEVGNSAQHSSETELSIGRSYS